MLYQFYETQRALLSPFAEFASATAKLYSHPLSPFAQAPGSERMAAGFDLLHRLTKEYEKPAFGITAVKVDGIDVAVQEQVVENRPFCRLLRFKRYTDNAQMLERMRAQPIVLVVAPLSGHHSTLLRDTVRTLLQDHKVYITDWVDARMVPMEAGSFHLADYIAYVQDFIRLLGPEVNVISVCQPTVPVLAAISLMASRGETTPRTMTMMGGPIDARKSPTAVNNLAMNRNIEWFENNVIYRVPQNFPGAGRRVYPGFMQHTGFVAMNPDRHANSHWDYFLDLVRGDDDSAEAHRQFYDEYNAVLDMDANYYLETIRTVFQDFSLVYGTWVVNGEPVRPQDIRTTALLTVEGELDDISGAGQTEAAHGLCSGIPAERREHYIVKGAGHYGIFSGRRWREMAYPEVRKFILEHQAPMKAPAVQAEVAPAVSAEAPVAAAEPVEVVEAVSTVDADAAAVTQTTEPVDAPETSTEASVEEAPAAVAPAAPRRGKSRR